jgi:hypothetical protein
MCWCREWGEREEEEREREELLVYLGGNVCLSAFVLHAPYVVAV